MTMNLRTKDDYMHVPESKGAGIIISDVICEQDGYLKLTNEAIVAGQYRDY